MSERTPEDHLTEEIMEALGAASMCWDETPKGAFQSDRAVEIGRRLRDFVKFTYPKLQAKEKPAALAAGSFFGLERSTAG